MKIKIEKRGKEIEVYTPYNVNFLAALKSAIGNRKWDPILKCWILPASQEERVRELLLAYYGWDDRSQLKTIRIKAVKKIDRLGTIVYFHNTPVVHAKYGRDGGAVVVGKTNLIHGFIDSGGSNKYPSAVVAEGTVLEITVPESAIKPDPNWEVVIEDDTEEVVETDNKIIDKSSLFKRAWEIARELAIKLTVNLRQAFSAALSLAWQEIK